MDADLLLPIVNTSNGKFSHQSEVNFHSNTLNE
jgi:hypothetical protein